MTISKFRNEYGFLSNFYYLQFIHEGHFWPTAEHAYQAAKTRRREWKEKIRETKTPVEARRVGKRMPIRKDWEKIKLKVIDDILRVKYRHQVSRLSDSSPLGNRRLEGSQWHDDSRGVCNCDFRKGCEVGANQFGKLLMKIRDDLKEKEICDESDKES